ncbi:MAG: beta-propeller fold lactonase family protein [Proteobacteria bacterium]|nr:beta-propeller fold lactonase family protein [Pseudomonadota bacterium]
MSKGDATRQWMKPTRKKRVISTRAFRRPVFFIIAVFLFLSGCSSDSSDQAPSSLSYTTGTAVYATGMLILSNSPTNSGGKVTSYTISPALPAGLSLNSITGVINGTPTTPVAETSYTVTATNSGGKTTTTLTISVSDTAPGQDLPNMGQRITPLAPLGAQFDTLNPDLEDRENWLAGQAVTSVVSPDYHTMLVLTSGYNRVYDALSPYPLPYPYLPDSNEYVFVYDITSGLPVKTQVVPVANTYNGITFDPSGTTFYVSGGIDDNIQTFTLNGGTWEPGEVLELGHTLGGNGLIGQTDAGQGSINLQVGVKACAAGVAISSDGLTLAVANYYNDSITLFTGGTGSWSDGTHFDLRPGKINVAKTGVPGGEYPFWVTLKGQGDNTTAYVSSIRDREIVVVNVNAVLNPDETAKVTTRISVKGQPGKMVLNAAQTLLYVVEDQSDTVDIINTTTNKIVKSIPVIAPAALIPSLLAQYTGANPNSVTLSPDEMKLYVTNGNLNCVAVVDLGDSNQVVGLIPTGWYPNSVSLSEDGNTLYVVNGKSPTGPNPNFSYSYGPPDFTTGFYSNEYNPQLIKAGLQTFTHPSTEQLTALTVQVGINNRFASILSDEDNAILSAVRQGIKHVIYIIKENRTYDQILGDLDRGNGDPALAMFGESMTPNQHNLAQTFVTLDNFLDTAEVSNDGWPWSTSGRAPDVIERQFAVAYAGRGLSLDSEGVNRNVNVALPTLAERRAASPLTPDDEDLLPGQTNVAAPDGPNNEVNTGYLWDSALRANLTVRNYGFFIDTTRYAAAPFIPLIHDPATTGTIVAYPSSASLAPFTDPFFRGFDNSFPDYYRFKEWEREFDTKYINGGETLPSLSLVRFMHDHTGNFGSAIDLVNTPERQVADNDYAVGLLVEKISKSKYANDTLVFIIEDDAQDGGDHVDSHRSVAFVAGAYVKQGAVISSQYNTIDFLRTIEEVLGLPPMNLNDALAKPMADIFTTTPNPWSFTATPSPYLYNTRLPLPPKPAGLEVPKTTHDAAYWENATKGMDFSSEDKFDFAAYNRVTWKGLKGDIPYPDTPSGKDLRKNRKDLLANHSASLKNSEK